MVVFQHNNYLKTCSQSLLDWNGDIVYDCSIPKCSSFYSRQFGFVIPESAQKFKFSLGNRIFHWTKYVLMHTPHILCIMRNSYCVHYRHVNYTA